MQTASTASYVPRKLQDTYLALYERQLANRVTSGNRKSALRYRSKIRPLSTGALRLLRGWKMRLERSQEVSELRTITLAQIERSLRAAARQGMAVKSITHHPDGRIVIALLETADETVSFNEWD